MEMTNVLYDNLLYVFCFRAPHIRLNHAVSYQICCALLYGFLVHFSFIHSSNLRYKHRPPKNMLTLCFIFPVFHVFTIKKGCSCEANTMLFS